MSQRDNTLNKEIGTQSFVVSHHIRMDSANMRTIAAVTLAFLPGTLVVVSQV
jgi:hypothetical protein